MAGPIGEHGLTQVIVACESGRHVGLFPIDPLLGIAVVLKHEVPRIAFQTDYRVGLEDLAEGVEGLDQGLVAVLDLGGFGNELPLDRLRLAGLKYAIIILVQVVAVVAGCAFPRTEIVLLAKAFRVSLRFVFL